MIILSNACADERFTTFAEAQAIDGAAQTFA